MPIPSFILFALSLIVLEISTVAAAEKMPLSTSYWKSSAFLKDFNGSYRINANIEPALTSSERGELVSIQSLMAKGDRAGAITKLKASKSFSSSAAIQFNLGNLLSEEGKLDEALTSYQKALDLLPSFRRAHQNIAYTHFKKNDHTKAFPHLIETVKLGGQDGSVYGLLAHCYQQSDQHEQALVAFRNAQLTQPETLDWKLGVGYSLSKLGRSDEAVAHFQSLLTKHPESTYATLQLASLYLEQGESTKAITKLELLRRQGQLEPSYEILLGTLYLGDRNATLGANTLRRALEKEAFSNHTAALQSIHYCLDLSLRDLASELYALIKKDALSPPQLVDFQRLQAQIILSEDPQSSEALTILDALTRANPTDSHSLYLTGRILSQQGYQHKAIIIHEQAINAQGTHSQQALRAKAEILVGLGSYELAIQDLQAYLKLQPSVDVRKYLDAVTRVALANSPK